jgi:hypothetical protein
VPKGGRVGKGKASDVFVSGDSFGGGRLQAKQAGTKHAIKRETIGENFLEEEDDGNSSGLAESGEIDPRLFR